ncbi:putative hydrolase domain protein [Lysobacter antibioticus]|uniref:hypothetical protein n=1 Tax=Lysobacter antibioticus TaxID=84531 RepID=UPI0007171BCE|nr:hypothetical protein [Lysobacter antibioticus]ALN65903.1 putative hydrolase domain protein [Lysobacter antibioticus]ALN65938.1 putative hydrolase domain protein [Lysobacter antibioticus]
MLSGGIVDRELDTADCLVFISEPFKDAEESSGLFCGRLEVETNKRNFDFNILLDEQLLDERYFEISRYQSRASVVGDVSRRQPL